MEMHPFQTPWDLCCSAMKKTPLAYIIACDFIPGQGPGDLLQACKDSGWQNIFALKVIMHCSGAVVVTIPAYTLLIYTITIYDFIFATSY